MRRVLVTGAEGFLGRRLVQRLAESWDVVAPRHGSPGLELDSHRGMDGLPAVDAVIHLAAAVGWGSRGGDAIWMWRVNARGTGRLMRWARRAGVHRVVYASSYVYGPGQRGEFLVPTILRQISTGVVVLRDPRPRRDLLYVDDAVEAFMAALLAPPGVHTLNIGSGRSHSVAEVLDQAEAADGVRCKRVYTGGDGNPVRETQADAGHALEVLGWRPRLDLDEGLARCVATAAREVVMA